MLMRLEHALNYPDLSKQMILVPGTSAAVSSNKINLVVGYNGSARSQTALDLTLWIAHQTRLATQRSVTVQVVYVVDETDDCDRSPYQFASCYNSLTDRHPEMRHSQWTDVGDRPEALATLASVTRSKRATPVATADCSEELANLSLQVLSSTTTWQIQQFEKADRILWQARNLADEWRGSLETHLRFGSIGEELRTVACQVSTTALILGCATARDRIVQALGKNLPFPILGIPAKISSC